MERVILKDKEGKKMAVVHLFLDCDYSITDRKKFVNSLVRQIRPRMGYGYAGYSHKKHLRTALLERLFWDPADHVEPLRLSKKKILRTIARTLQICEKQLPSLNVPYIYVFPTYHNFVIKNMGGTTGTAPWKETMMLFINPVKGWDKKLSITFTHEYNHTVAMNHVAWKELLNKMVIEGFAETFVDDLLGPRAAYVGRSIGYKRSRLLFKKVKNKLKSKSEKLYQEVFYNVNNKFPNWAGYAIGYWIVKGFRRNNPKLKWQEILKISPEEILANSKFA